MTNQLLPPNPDYQQACDLIDNAPDGYWEQVISQIATQHQLDSQWQRLRDGGNVLFKLAEQFIIKIVPPNWARQGEAEVEAAGLLANQLSIAAPQVIAHGKLNNWVYVVMTLLPGISLANIWPQLTVAEKRPIIAQVGRLMKELHQLPMNLPSSLKPNWQEYQRQLIDDCIPRHQRKKLAEKLVAQIGDYLDNTEDYFDDLTDDPKTNEIFIHMDLHPWNLMVDKHNGVYQLSGLLDFGDAIVGKSRLIELNTPLLFMCQGNAELTHQLFDSYQLMSIGANDQDKKSLRKKLMVVALLRPACDFNFVLAQVPQSGPRDTLQQIAEQLFAF